jgi:hypothetical protein
LDSALTVERFPRGRSRITNKVRASPLGLDGRSERGRRWRDLIDGLIAAYGADEPDRIRELATLKLSLEATQAAVINGDILRSEDLIRLANAITRCEKPLRARARVREAQAPAHGLASYLEGLTPGSTPEASPEPTSGHREGGS